MQTLAFQRLVMTHYRTQGRHGLPWRQPTKAGGFDPYHILVSEIMLQQTQVPRVIPKFLDFVQAFPSFDALAKAPLATVLQCWSGLGYNRRAKFLWEAARVVSDDYHGQLPSDRQALERLPGIGPNTAGAILAYAFNQPVIFIETNIRTVFIHHFFADAQKVTDAQIADMVARMLPDNPRQWYWALMDYGTHLKQTSGAQLHKVHGYRPQSTFEGSRRQIRGQVLRVLAAGPMPLGKLKEQILDERLADVLADLQAEGFIQESASYYKLTGA